MFINLLPTVFFFSTFFFIAHAVQEQATFEISLPASLDQLETLLRDFPDSLLVDTAHFSSDVPIWEQELRYLFNVKQRTAILTRRDICRACWLVQQKQRFEKIIITLLPTPIGAALQIQLIGHWTLHKVKIYGFLLNKDRFGSYYLLEPGQRFDLEKHQQSLERIKNVFKEDGYFSADVRERLVFDEKTKSVTVHLTIDRKSQFRISNIQVDAKSANNVTDEERVNLEQKVIAHLQNSLMRMYYTKALVDQEIKSLKAYVRKKGYLRTGLKVKEIVDRSTSTVVLVVSFTVYKKKKLVFFGNHFFSDSELLESISLFGKATAHVPSSIIAAEIEDVYKKAGFLAVYVQTEDEEDRCMFVINEDKRAYGNKFVIEGNHAFTCDELMQSILNGFSMKCLDADTLGRIKEKIDHFYHQKGFWESTSCIIPGECDHDGLYTLYVRIHEGAQRFLGVVEIPGFSELVAQPLFAGSKDPHNPLPLDSDLIERQRQYLNQYLYERGHLHAYVKPEFEDNHGLTTLRWQVKGPMRPITFGKTVITGNSRLPYDIIARELVYKEGTRWDREKITRTVDNLRKLSVFDVVSWYPLEGADYEANFSEDSKPLVLQVIDGSPLDARLRIGYQQIRLVRGSTYKVGGSLLLRNPTNRADIIRCDADVTQFYRSISTQYEVPWIFGRPVQAVLRGYVQTYEQPLFRGSRDILYTADLDGLCLRLLKLLEYGDVTFASGCEAVRIRDLPPPLARVINFEPQLVGERITYFFLEPQMVLDVLDDCLNPTWGALTTCSLRAMVAWHHGDLSLIKGLFEQSFFFPVTEKIVGAVRWRCGHIFHDNFSTLIPTERFYLGGPYSVRGFEPNMAPPLGFFGTDEKIPVPIGGKTMFNINLEVRVPLTGKLGGVLFQDVGALIARRLGDLRADDISAASGFGFRYVTPIGPLRFDLGVKWKKRFKDDCRSAWFFTFGHAF